MKKTEERKQSAQFLGQSPGEEGKQKAGERAPAKASEITKQCPSHSQVLKLAAETTNLGDQPDLAERVRLAVVATKKTLPAEQQVLWNLKYSRQPLSRIEIAEHLGIGTADERAAERQVAKIWAGMLKNLEAGLRERLSGDPIASALLAQEIRKRSGWKPWLVRIIVELGRLGLFPLSDE